MFALPIRLRFWLLAALVLTLSALMGTTFFAGSGAAPAAAPAAQPAAVTFEPATSLRKEFDYGN
jgi:hypothetical protein